jgi:hypothetical protein
MIAPVSSVSRPRLPIPDFDGFALYTAMDARRATEGLSWQAVADAIWSLSSELNTERNARGLRNHPIVPATLRGIAKRGDTSCQHALFILRWLQRTPESFLAGAGPDAGRALPACGPDRRPRWNLQALYEAMNAQRGAHGWTWAVTAAALGCTPSQVAGLKNAKFATGMKLAMRITQWVEQPAADFIYPARW